MGKYGISFLSLILVINISIYGEIYRLVIDPGHGGKRESASIFGGDRYSKIKKRYLTSYNSGAEYKGIREDIIVFDLAVQLKERIEYYNSHIKELRKLFYRYGYIISTETNRFVVFLSRPDSYDRTNFTNNSVYRLFDSENSLGRLSFINSIKPDLIISLHLSYAIPGLSGGYNSVIVPGFYQMLKIIKDGPSYFYSSPFKIWYTSCRKTNRYKEAYRDIFYYLTGLKLNSEMQVIDSYSGMSWNMLSWDYNTAEKPNEISKIKIKNSKLYLQQCKFTNLFWQREKSRHEIERRSNGPEGYGGDNLFAAMQILRFVRYALSVDLENEKVINKKIGFLKPNIEIVDKKEAIVGRIYKPYIAPFVLPLYTNAITAYLEIGYIDRYYDMLRLTGYRNSVINGIILALYSFIGEVKRINTYKAKNPHKKKYKVEPIKIDLIKYRKDF